MDTTIAVLLQISLILIAARVMGEISVRLKQPAVLGELLAGVVLGPSLFGHFLPEMQKSIFGEHTTLDGLSTLALVLLLLLTGLETDVRVMRGMGRSAFFSSAFGMLIPFLSGLGLGYLLDDSFVMGEPKERLPLAMMLATSMAVSAMPVIAKILMDLKMIKRNFGIIALSAAIVDDTLGWIILAMISGILTTHQFHALDVIRTLSLVAIFVAGVRYLIYPILIHAMPHAEHEMKLPGGDIALVLAVTLLCAALTEAMHVHAVFGAFIAGMTLRQCPTLSAESTHKLESITMVLLSPLFFASVGLRVDLSTFTQFNLAIVVFLIAVFGKIIGCYLGGILGKMPRWESLAVGVCMSARGAVGLVVAKIGYDLHVLNTDLFSILVVMAVLTSFMAPLLLRLIVYKLPMTDEEQARDKGEEAGFIPSGRLKIMVPVGGGDNAIIGVHLASHLCQSDGDRCTVLHVERRPLRWWLRAFTRRKNLNLEAYLEQIKSVTGTFAPRVNIRSMVANGSVASTVLAEASKGYQFIVVGASGRRSPANDPFIGNLVKNSRAHVVLVLRAKDEKNYGPFRNILVPFNGSYYADAAFAWTAAYARAVDAKITSLYIVHRHSQNPLLPTAWSASGEDHMQQLMRSGLKEQLGARLDKPDRLDCRVRNGDSVVAPLLDEMEGGGHDLVVLGAENKSLVERLYLGQHIEAALAELPCAVAVVIPRMVTAGAAGQRA